MNQVPRVPALLAGLLLASSACITALVGAEALRALQASPAVLTASMRGAAHEDVFGFATG